MSREQAEVALKAFGEKVGIPEMGFDEDGYCCLFFDDLVINLEIDEETERLFFYSNIGELADKKSEKFYEMLLEANFLFRETEGAVIGIDTQGNVVCLCYQMPLKLVNEETFEAVLENFVNLTERWTQKIRDFTLEDSAEEEMRMSDFSLKV